MKVKIYFVWILQLIIAVLLIPEAWGKLNAAPGAVFVFSELGMEPTGRIIIGIVESCAALFLLTNRLAATGAALTIGTMLGAIIAHASILGFTVGTDAGRHVMLLTLVMVSALIIAYVRRAQLPIIGSTLR